MRSRAARDTNNPPNTIDQTQGNRFDLTKWPFHRPTSAAKTTAASAQHNEHPKIERMSVSDSVTTALSSPGRLRHPQEAPTLLPILDTVHLEVFPVAVNHLVEIAKLLPCPPDAPTTIDL